MTTVYPCWYSCTHAVIESANNAYKFCRTTYFFPEEPRVLLEWSYKMPCEVNENSIMMAVLLLAFIVELTRYRDSLLCHDSLWSLFEIRRDLDHRCVSPFFSGRSLLKSFQQSSAVRFLCSCYSLNAFLSSCQWLYPGIFEFLWQLLSFHDLWEERKKPVEEYWFSNCENFWGICRLFLEICPVLFDVLLYWSLLCYVGCPFREQLRLVVDLQWFLA